MTYSQRRVLNTLLSIVAVLAALLLVVTLMKRRRAQQEAVAAAASSEEIVAAGTGEYGTLTYSNGTATLSFATDGDGAWYWADDSSFPLAQTYVTRIVDTITSLKPQQTITGGDALEDYGLSQPAMTVTAASGTVVTSPDQSVGERTETESLTLYIGNQVSGGSGSYYLYIDGAPETVYVVSDTLVTQLSRGIYDMMELPELPRLQEADIKTVAVQGPSTPAAEGAEPAPGLTSTLTAYAGENTVSWRSDGADVTGVQRVQDLISLLAALTLDRCVDYKPSGDAASLCGFDAPAATAEVKYQAGGAEELQTLTLLVGGVTLDGGSRYVRVNDDTTIYAISAETLSPLLSVAETGLEESES